jgi:hypothetical protein
MGQIRIQQPPLILVDPRQQAGKDIHHAELGVQDPHEHEHRRHVREGPRQRQQAARERPSDEPPIEQQRRCKASPDGHTDNRRHVHQGVQDNDPERRVGQHALVVGQRHKRDWPANIRAGKARGDALADGIQDEDGFVGQDRQRQQIGQPVPPPSPIDLTRRADGREHRR